jgi:hypothetical protein
VAGCVRFQVLGRAAWGYKAAVIRSLRPITRAAGSAGPSSASAWQASSFSQAAQVDGGPVDGNFQRPWKAIPITSPGIVNHARVRAGSWRKGVLACDVSFLWGPWRRTARDEFGALGGPSCAVSVLEPAIDLTTVSQPWPPQILHQAFDAASGWQLSGTGPD